jgi:secondary thiamine-phosphate synthase enzyme
MEISNHDILFQSRGDCDLIDITDRVNSIIHEAGMETGNVVLFVPGATGGLTTIEYEGGLVRDFREVWERLVPSAFNYHHNERWGDGNGHSHLRASIVGPSLTIPFVERRLRLGTWQQVVFVDFDNRPRRRTVAVQLCGK